MQKGDDFRNFLIIKKMEEDKNNKSFLSKIINNKVYIFLTFLTIFFIFSFYQIFLTPANLTGIRNENNLFQINNGETIDSIAEKLKEEGIVKSSFIFKLYMKVLGNDNSARAGIYKFTDGESVLSIVNKIKNADYAVPPVKITIPEGSDNQEIANLISKAFLNEVNQTQLVDDFSEEKVSSEIKSYEGYLFPETYFFLPNDHLDVVIKSIRNKFFNNLKKIIVDYSENEYSTTSSILALDLNKLKVDEYFAEETKTINLTKRLSVLNEVGTTTVSLKDIITMASYLEGEANNELDMKMVAGVLWTRLKLNYPLQIDAATSTYKSRGFTNTPINNPGIIAIRAAIDPINEGYIYYITGNDGKTYYAHTYEEHLANINKYLRNR